MSLSDFSDLTELSSSEDEPATKSQKSKKLPKQYKITNVLRPPRTTQYTAKSLYDQIIDNSIDLDPEYQRDVVWNEEKQIGLIDSILRNYYMPPIIFAVSTQEDGSELRTCIDGKQRLTSIQRFIDGQICHRDSYTNEKVWYKASASHPRGKVLPAPLRAIFANKQIVCVEYSDLNDNQEREIFQRVQLGVALTPAERLQAIVGPWPTVIRDIQSQILGEEGFEGYLDWGHARGRDFQCLATIGYLIESYPKPSIPHPKSLEKWLHGTDPVKKSLIIDLQDTFRIFLILARDKRYSSSFNQPTRVSPIEFVMTGVLIYLKRSSLSLTQLSSAIEQMRKDVRATEKDIRSNSRVTKLMYDFVNKRLKVSALKKDGKGDIPATIATREHKPSAKRKRPTETDDDESDSEPPPRKVPAAKSSNSTAAKTASKSTKQVPAKKTSPPTVTATAATKTRTTVSRKSTAATASAESSKQSTPKPSARPTPKLPARQPIPKPPAPVVDSTTKQPPVYQPPVPQPPPALSKPSHSISIPTAPAIKAEPMIPSFPAPSQSPSVQSPVTQSSFMDRLAPIRAAKAALVGSNGGNQSNQVARPSTPVSSSFGQPHLLTNGLSGALVSSSGNPVHPLPPKPSTSRLDPSQYPPQPPPPQHPPPPQYPPPPQHPPPPQYPPPPQPPLSLQRPPPSVPRLAQPPLPPPVPGYPPTLTQAPVQQQQQSSGSFQGNHALPPRPPPTGPSFLAQQHVPRADSPVSAQGSHSHALPARPRVSYPFKPPRASSISGGSYPESDRLSHNTAPERRQSLDERRPTGGYDSNYGSGRGWERERDSDLRGSWGRGRDLPPHQRGGRPGRGRGRPG